MRSLSFSEAVVRKCYVKKLLIKFCQSSLATSLKKRLRNRCVCSCEFSKILQKNLAEHLQMAGSGFCTFPYVSHSINHFINRDSKKGNLRWPWGLTELFLHYTMYFFSITAQFLNITVHFFNNTAHFSNKTAQFLI